MKSIRIMKYGIILFLTGFAALVYEIVFIKTLSLFLGQSIYAFSVMLAAFMFGIGIGSLSASKLKGEPLWIFSLTQTGIAAYSLIFIPLVNNSGIPVYIAAGFPFYLKSGSLIIISMLLLIVPTALMGLGFPLLVRHAKEESDDNKIIGRLFAYNTIGGLLGSLAAGFILLPHYGVSISLFIAAAINLFAAISIKTKARVKRIIAAVVILLLFIYTGPEIDPHAAGTFYNADNYASLSALISGIEKSRNYTEVLYSDFDVYGHVCVMKTGQYKILLINGKPDGGTSEDVTTEYLTGYIPMLLHENPEKTAIVGLGTGLTAGAVLQFDIDKLDLYEINPGVVEANKYFAVESHFALSDQRTKLIMGDARRNLSLSGEQYDVIISEPSNPWVEGEGFLFTKEYYEIIDEHLRENGIFVQWIGAYEYSEEDFYILLNTIRYAFPFIQIWSDGTDFYLIVSREAKRFNFAKTLTKINEPVIKADMQMIGFFEEKDIHPVDIFFSHYLTEYEKTIETKLNTDDNSIIEFSTGRNTEKSPAHFYRITGNQARIVPVDLTRNDFDIEFKSDLPEYDVRYLITQTGLKFIINKQIIFQDGTNTLFIQTQAQNGPPSIDEAKELADHLNAELQESEKYLFSFKTGDVNGIIGYCPDTQKSFIAYSSKQDPLIINCKEPGDSYIIDNAPLR